MMMMMHHLIQCQAKQELFKHPIIIIIMLPNQAIASTPSASVQAPYATLVNELPVPRAR
jgi:hypothetical protein